MDPTKKPAEKPAQPAAGMEPTQPTVEIGAPGLAVYGGRISEEFLPELSGSKAAKVYREMSSNDGIVGAILFAIRMLIRQAQWTVEAASQSPEDLQAAEFLRTCQQDMSHTWGEFIDEVLSMLVYGFHLSEAVYKRREGPDAEVPSRFDDGLIGWKRLAPRAQTTIEQWDLDDAGEVRGVFQQAPPRWARVFIPADRLLLFRPGSHKNNPEGMSVLRTAYRSWYFKKHIENMEAIGIERDLCGLPVVDVPESIMNATAGPGLTAKTSYQQLATQVRRNEASGVLMPSTRDQHGQRVYDLRLLSSGGERQFDTNAVINRHDQRIAMSALADFILIGHEKTGSFALASSKTELFSTAIATWLDAIQETLNRDAVPRLFKLNPQFKLEALPTFKAGDIEKPDLGELGAYVQALTNAGIVFSPGAEEHLLTIGGLPTAAEEELEPGDEEPDDEAEDEKPPTEGKPADPSAEKPPAEAE